MNEHTELTDMELDEISLVSRGANQHAKVVLYKGTGGDRQADCSVNHNRMNPGNTCKECGYVKKAMDEEMEYGEFGEETEVEKNCGGSHGSMKKGDTCKECGFVRKGGMYGRKKTSKGMGGKCPYGSAEECPMGRALGKGEMCKKCGMVKKFSLDTADIATVESVEKGLGLR